MKRDARRKTYWALGAEMKRGLLRCTELIVCAICCASVSACGPDITDLKFVSADIVSAADARLRWSPPSAEFLKLKFSSHVNLFKFDETNKLEGLQADVSICNDRTVTLKFDRSVWWDEIRVELWNVAEPEHSKIARMLDGINPIVYHTYVQLKHPGDDLAAFHDSTPIISRYDLREDPEDLCLKVYSYKSLAWLSYRGNIVTFPKGALIDAFKRTGAASP